MNILVCGDFTDNHLLSLELRQRRVCLSLLKAMVNWRTMATTILLAKAM